MIDPTDLMCACRDWIPFCAPNETGTREHLAARADLHWTSVGQIERGERYVSLRSILKIAEVLYTDPGQLIHSLHSW